MYKLLVLEPNKSVDVSSKYLTDIIYYKHEESEQDEQDESPMTPGNKYRQYLEKLIPSSDKLFEIIKDRIQNAYSIHGVTKCLEPFDIEHKNIANSLYRKIYEFVQDEIQKFNTKLKKVNEDLSSLTIESKDMISGLRFLFEKTPETYDNILKGYGISDEMRLTDDEIYSRVLLIDHGRFLNAGISLASIRLMILHDSPCIEDYEAMLREKNAPPKNDETNECEQHVLSKKYTTLEELKSDNSRDIVFDKEYDNTYYDLLDEYARELESIPEERQKDALIQKLRDVNGLNESKAIREARAMLEKQRVVVDGDYAILQIQGDDPKYYKRSDNEWVVDPMIDPKILTDENRFFCNLNEKCVYKGESCNSMDSTRNSITSELEEHILKEFDTALKTTKDEYMKKIVNDYKRCEKTIHILRNLYQRNGVSKFIDDNTIFFKQPSLETQHSPYEALRDSILGQSDIVKKHKDIRNFINKFTRNSNIQDGESDKWLYCKQTNTKLIPSFYDNLSIAFMNGVDEFMREIQKICDERGVPSDDNSSWVDKFSGYIITRISFDTQEGFTEEGFRINTRALLDDDEPIIPVAMEDDDEDYKDRDTRLIMRVINDMEKFIGLRLGNESGKIFIRRLVMESLRNIEKKINEQNYDAIRSKHRNYPVSYVEFKNNHIVHYTLSYFVICIQTSIPELKSGPQYPRCTKSFYGYPLNTEDEGDKGGIKYVACVANKIKSNIEPWDDRKSEEQRNRIQY